MIRTGAWTGLGQGQDKYQNRTSTRGERRTRTEQDKGQVEKNYGRRTKKGKDQEKLEDRYKMRTMAGDRDRQGKEE